MDDIILPPKKSAVNESGPKTETAETDLLETKVKSLPDKPQPKRRKRLTWLRFRHQDLSRKQWVLVIAIIILLLGGGGTGAYYLYKYFTKIPKQAAVKPKAKVTEPLKPTTEPSRLTGVEVATELNQRPVTGIIIENSPEARPQAGLKDAGIVYEAIAEGGITRFLALFQESQPDYIGPVRSARPYFLDWLLPFDAAIAHVGGSPDALQQIKALGVRDLDQFANSGAYQRIAARFAPHNVYTSTTQLDALMKAKGFTSSTFTSFPRKKEAPGTQPTARTIDFTVSGYLYNVRYEYDALSNSYKRNEGGKPHIDERSGAQLQPKVVIGLVMGYGIASDGQHSVYKTTGSGVMYVFQDGAVTQGTWRKDDRKTQFVFMDAQGAPLKLNPGQTWLTVVDASTDVTYAP